MMDQGESFLSYAHKLWAELPPQARRPSMPKVRRPISRIERLTHPGDRDEKPTLVWIEDDLDFVNRHAQGLKESGFRLRHCSTGKLGLSAVRAADVVLLDLKLPDMTGEDVLRCVGGTLQVPIVVFTGHPQLLRVELSTRLGAHDYLQKPGSTVELVYLLKRLVEEPFDQHPGSKLAEEMLEALDLIDERGHAPAAELRLTLMGWLFAWLPRADATIPLFFSVAEAIGQTVRASPVSTDLRDVLLHAELSRVIATLKDRAEAPRWSCIPGSRPTDETREAALLLEWAARNGTAMSLNELMDRFGLSESRLSHMLKEQTGLTALEWTTCVRVQPALRRLFQTNKQFKGVATDAGYGNQDMFDRDLKRIFSLTASQLRAAYREAFPNR